MAYSEPKYWLGGPTGEQTDTDEFNKYADNLDALIAILETEVNYASGTKFNGSHPLFGFAHRSKWLKYISESEEATGAIVGFREIGDIEERLPYAATENTIDLEQYDWMVQGKNYAVREVRFAAEVDG